MSVPSDFTLPGKADSAARFEALVDRCYAPAYRFALALTLSPASAEKLVAETLRDAQVDGVACDDIGVFTAIRHRHTGVNGGAASPRDPASGASALLTALETLDPPARALCVLFYSHELSCHEIAAILSLDIAEVLALLPRAKAALRDALGASAAAPPRTPETAPGEKGV